jgi:predicted O-methyltransferase YrrM
MSTPRSPAVAAVLDRLRATAAAEDEAGKARVRARESELGRRVYGSERTALYGSSPIGVTAEVGELLYLLVLARRPAVVVEFGASHGGSTIYLAAAVRDVGAGRIVTTELGADRALAARQNLVSAGLDDLVELREGDARDTLASLDEAVELVFLDGWNDLYLPVLLLLEPRLAPGGLVAADMSRDDPHLDAYRDYVGDPGNGYHAIEVPLDDGVVLAVRAAADVRR